MLQNFFDFEFFVLDAENGACLTVVKTPREATKKEAHVLTILAELDEFKNLYWKAVY